MMLVKSVVSLGSSESRTLAGKIGSMPSSVSAKVSLPAAAPIGHYENFPVASWLCPAALRAPIAAVYHFARTADDLADEGTADPQERLADLAQYRTALTAASRAAFQSDIGDPTRWEHVFIPLQQAIQTYQLPVALLHDLLDAFVQDIENTREQSTYRDETALWDYCGRSANPVGRLLLHLYGVTDAQALQESDAICTALQLVNFWQDLSVDIPRRRYYLTDADLTRFGVSMEDVVARKQTPGATQLIAACAYSARASMLKGAPLVHKVPGRAGWELRMVVQGGLRILDKIEAMHFATLNQRPRLRWWDAPVMLWRAVWM